MMIILIISALIIGTSAAAVPKSYIDYRLHSNLTALSVKSLIQPRDVVCSVPGPICDEDCERLWTCINGVSGLQASLSAICKAPQSCNNGACSATPSRECSPAGKKSFPCKAEGVFPDPITCKKYHYCIETDKDRFEDRSRNCERHQAYNPRTTYCDKKINNDKCNGNYPVPICKKPNQNGALRDNPSIFYVCLLYENGGDVLYPYLYLCPNGKVYNGQYDCK